MLKKRNANEGFGKIDSIIGANAVVRGNLETEAATRIDGVVQGDITSKGTLVVGAGGKITGNIYAAYIMVAGEVKGDLCASEKIEVSSTGKVIGNIQTKSLVVDENAMFQGQCVMNLDKKEEPKAAETKVKETANVTA